MTEPVEFRAEITLTKDEVLDVVGRCHEVLSLAEESGQVEISFAVEGVRRLLLGRLMGEPGALDD